jgi:hypothetical protein
LLLLTLSACAANPGGGFPAVRGTTPPTQSIEISRGPCFGFCPVYDVRVRADGELSFEGRRHTAVLGTKERRVPTAVFLKLIRELAPFRPAGSEEVQVVCGAAVTDTPRYTITWTDVGGTRSVATHQGGCPSGPGQRLDGVLQHLPERLGIGPWTKQTTRPGASRG